MTPMHPPGPSGKWSDEFLDLDIKFIGASLYCKTKSGVILLHWAAQRPKPAVLQAFIEHGCDLEFTNPKDANKWTALHQAAHLSLSGPCALLVQAKADLEAKDHAGMTPLHLNCHKISAFDKKLFAQSFACAKVLLDAGTDVNALSKNSSTPLSLSAYNNDVKVFALLIRKGSGMDPGVIGEHGFWNLAHTISNSIEASAFNSLLDSARATLAIDKMLDEVAKEKSLSVGIRL